MGSTEDLCVALEALWVCTGGHKGCTGSLMGMHWRLYGYALEALCVAL